jgi:hypothetical protein
MRCLVETGSSTAGERRFAMRGLILVERSFNSSALDFEHHPTPD